MYFHAAMVHHRDIGECKYGDKSVPHIDTDGFNCNIEQQAITCPFFPGFESITLEPIIGSHIEYSEFPAPDLFSISFHSDSRGPPNS